MKITFVSPRIEKTRFTGGAYCILRHANELVSRGHDVSVVAFPKSVAPEWIELKAKLIVPRQLRWPSHLPRDQAALAMASYALDYVSYGYKGDYYARAAAHAFLPSIMPDSDITLATAWDTASLVAKHGKGKKAYFCQHYEPLFFQDEVGRSDVEATYSYGLTLIANSSWLKSRLERRLRAVDKYGEVYLATNAIDPTTFTADHNGRECQPNSPQTIRVISYGGRDAQWKGFAEMAMAIRAARKALPEKNIEWSVYGAALLSPENNIAPYKHLGFLNQAELSTAYRMNDILLSASWYESFPLFPIEAMASGLAVITTAHGTEDYACDGKNCLIVQPKDIDSIAKAIIRLACDPELLNQLASSARQVTELHDWGTAGLRMEKVLHRIASTRSSSSS